QVDLRPPQIAVLQHVIGFGCRAEDFVDDREQQRTQVREPIGVLGTHPTATDSPAGRFPPRSQKIEPGLRPSRAMKVTVPLQISSLITAAGLPAMNVRRGVSSVCDS